MKYDSQITELKNLLPNAKSVLIALPVGADIDKLASGLTLMLALNAQGKEVTVVSDDSITVGQSHLYGIDHISKNLPSGQGGNLTISLEGVAAANNTIPALEKLDWFAEGSNLNLVFHVLPGQTFQPSKIVPHYQGSSFNLIFVIGAANLDSLGSLYKQSPNAFSGVHIVNIDNQNNASFGSTNIVDTTASSVSEIVANLMSDLGINLDADSASNLLAGIFDTTQNLVNGQLSADTYLAVANLLRAGGKKPGVPQSPTQPNLSALIPPDQTFSQPSSEFTTPPVVAEPTQAQPIMMGNNQPSPEERPVDEGVSSETIEPEWLTPKIFKGSSLG